MTPHRTGGKSGNFEFDRTFRGVGRIRQTSGTPSAMEFRRRDGLLTKLFRRGDLDVLNAFKSGEVAIEQLVQADANDKVRSTLDAVKLKEPLWDAIERLLPTLGKSSRTRRRRQTSFKALQVKGKKWLKQNATVGDLIKVDWHDLQAAWGNSAADFNRMRSSLSVFLSAFLGKNRRAGKMHPVRYEIMADIPVLDEPEPAAPDVSPEVFLSIVSKIDDPTLAAPFWTIALTGFRIGEYLACGESDLMPHTHRVRNPTGKTGARDVAVDPEHWAWIEAGIPCRLGKSSELEVQYDPRYKRMRRIWKKACAAAEVKAPTFHQLRHCHGQWASDAGVADAMIGEQLGHKDAKTTRRYTKQNQRAGVAIAVGNALTAAKKKRAG